MELNLNDSLDRFRQLVEKDLTSLSAAWSLLNDKDGDLLVQALLLEKRCKAEEYHRVHNLVQCLEEVPGYPGLNLDFKPLYLKVLEHRKAKLKRTGNAKGLYIVKHVFCRLAGLDNCVRGAAILGIRTQVPDRQMDMDFSLFYKGMDERDAKVLLECFKYLRSTSVKIRKYAIRDKGKRSPDDVREFERRCKAVFMGGKRYAVAEEGRYKAHRALYKSVTEGRQVPLASSKMSLLCSYVHVTCFGPVEKDITHGLDDDSKMVIDSLAASIPAIVHNYMHKDRDKMPVGPMPSKNLVKHTMDALAKAGNPVPTSYAHRKGNSIRGTRYDHTGLSIKNHGGCIDKDTLGLKGRLAVLSDSSINYKFTKKSLKEAQWILSSKDIALIKRVHLDGVEQRVAAKEMGVTQGAVSHRLATARTRIRLLSPLGGMPSAEEVAAMAECYLPVRDKPYNSKVSPSKLLSALAKAGGNQVRAAKIAGYGQPTISIYLKRYSDILESKVIAPEHDRAAKFVKLASTYPYAFQHIHLPHFKWNTRAINRNQLKQKKKAVR